MVANIFLEVDGVEGESVVEGFVGKIDIVSWNWGMSQPATFQTGSGGGSSKPNVQDLSLTKYLDKATTPMMQKLCKGTHFEKAKLTVRKVTGDTPLDYLVIEMRKVIMSSYSTGAGMGSDDRIMENLTLNFASFTMTYKTQGDDGVESGSVPVTYDIAGSV